VIEDRHQIRFTIVASQSVIITTDLEFRKGGDEPTWPLLKSAFPIKLWLPNLGCITLENNGWGISGLSRNWKKLSKIVGRDFSKNT